MNRFGEWLPDQPALENPGVTLATNVVPVAAGYKAMKTMADYSGAADAYLRGIFAGKGSNDTNNLFAGDATKLYLLSAGDSSLANKSKSGNYTLGTKDAWRFVQFGDRVIAAHGTDDILQSYVIGTSSLFADLSGTPAARYIAVVRDFVVTGYVRYSSTTHPWRVYWSAIDDATGWTIGTNQSDIQDIADIGNITGIVGGEYGVVLFENGIVRMTYAGSPLIFQFDKVETSRGCPYPGSVANVGPFVFYLSQDGFYLFDGNSSRSIGSEKIDRTFFDEFDKANAHRMTVGVDPRNKLIIWSYPTTSSTPNKILVYNYLLERWSSIELEHDSVASFFSPSYTLENVDNVNSSIDALETSLDDALWVGGEFFLGGSKDKKIQTFTGAALTATVQTAEFENTPGQASMVTQIQPYVTRDNDATTPAISAQVASRARPHDLQSFGTASNVNANNFIPLRSSGRFHQIKFSASDFGTFQGFDMAIQAGGMR